MVKTVTKHDKTKKLLLNVRLVAGCHALEQSQRAKLSTSGEFHRNFTRIFYIFTTTTIISL